MGGSVVSDRGPLAGRRIAMAEGRQLEELAAMLVKEGAEPLRYPLLSILDAPDPEPIRRWLDDLIADRFAYVILLTGEGLRRLVAFADRAGIRAAVVEAFGRTQLVTRGPKPVQAAKEIGLRPALVATTPTTAGVIAALEGRLSPATTVGVQLYAAENALLTDFLTQVGSPFRTVLPYIYAPASDVDRVVELIDRMAGGEIDAVVFTSSPQIDRLTEVAREQNRVDPLKAAMDRTRIAAVGPIVADTLRTCGFRVDITPEQGFQMKNLVVHIKRAFSS